MAAKSKRDTASKRDTPAKQFVRETGYSIAAGQGAPYRNADKKVVRGRARSTGRGVIGELVRDPAYCPHVSNAKPPRTLYGKPVGELVAWWDELVAQARQVRVRAVQRGIRRPRRQRSDTPIMIGCVASYDGPADDRDHRYLRWKLRVIAWAKRHYAYALISVVEHTDETHGHVHIIAADQGRPMKPWMAGHAAAMMAKGQGLTGKAVSDAFRDGCRRLQNSFWRVVGRPLGMLRISDDPQPRMDYRTAKRVRVQLNAIEADRRALDQARAALAKAQAQAAADQAAILVERARLRAIFEALDGVQRDEAIRQFKAIAAVTGKGTKATPSGQD